MDTAPSTSSKSYSTRLSKPSLECPFFGVVRPLPQNFIPTKSDVILDFLRVQNELPPFSTIDAVAQKEAEHLEQTWLKLFGFKITKPLKAIKAQIIDYYKPFKNQPDMVKRSYTHNRQLYFHIGKTKEISETLKHSPISIFIEESKKIFDIAVCQISKTFNQFTCNCANCQMLPSSLLQFLHDSRHGLQPKLSNFSRQIFTPPANIVITNPNIKTNKKNT